MRIHSSACCKPRTRRLFRRIPTWAGLSLLALCVTGCFGPVSRPVAEFTICPDGSAGRLDYWFVSTSTTVEGHWIEETTWEFDDESAPTVSWGEVLHRYDAPGTYYVTLTVTDSRGVSGTITKPIDIELAAYVHSAWRLTLGYPPTVTGIVENRHTEPLLNVVVRAKFYNADGVRLTDGSFTVTDLEPGERAAFKIEANEFTSLIFAAAVDIASFEADCMPWRSEF